MASGEAKHSGATTVSRGLVRQRTFHKDPDVINPSLNLPVIDPDNVRGRNWDEHTQSKDTPHNGMKTENSLCGQCGNKTAVGTASRSLSTNVSRDGQLEVKLKATTEALEMLKQDKATLDSKIANLGEQKSHWEEDNKRLKDNIKRMTEENSVLEDKLRATQMDLKSCTERVNEKVKAEKELQADALRMQSESCAMASNLSALKTEMNTLKSRVKEAEKQHSDQLSVHKEESTRLSWRVRELEQETSELRESVRRTEIEKEKLMALDDIRRVHQDRLQKADIEKEKLHKELESLREEYRGEKLRVSEYKHQVSQIITVKDKLTSEKVAQEKELRQLRSDVIKGQEFSATLLKRIADYNSQIDSILQHNKALLLVLDKERSETNELQKRLQQCESDQKTLKHQLEDRSQGHEMSVEKPVDYKNIVEENKKLRLQLMEKEFESTHLLSDREKLKEKLVEMQKQQATYEENLVDFKALAKDIKIHPEAVASGPIKDSASNGQNSLETEKLNSIRRSFPVIKAETKTKEMHFSWTVNYSTRRKYLQQLRRERRW